MADITFEPSRNNEGQLNQRLPDGFWEKHLPKQGPVQRLKRKAPCTVEQLTADIYESGDALQYAIEKYNREQGTNPNQARILELTEQIFKLTAKLRPLEAELRELQTAATPTDAVLTAVAKATQAAQNLAREAHEVLFRCDLALHRELRVQAPIFSEIWRPCPALHVDDRGRGKPSDSVPSVNSCSTALVGCQAIHQ